MLGDEALDLDSLAEQRKRALGDELPGISLGDFFFDPDDPLNPDAGDHN